LRLELNMRRRSSNDVPAAIAAIALGLGAMPAPSQIAYTDVTNAAGVAHSSESYGASWGDLDGDGYPDLFASNHRTQPSLFLNLGNGSFRDIATKTADWVSRPGADTHGASWADFDNDGDQDLMVSVGTGNPSQFLVNENQQLVDRTAELGLDFSNLGGRLPVWLDYDNDHRLDVVVTQYGGIAKLFHQNPGGGFTETTSAAKLLCIRFHYAQLFDANGDGRLDFLCPDESAFPQKIYDTSSLPWKKLFDSAQPAAFFPLVNNVADSAIADFNNDGRMDLFVLGGVQLRPSSVVQEGSKIEALLAGGSKGFKFVTTGLVTFIIDWNKADEGDGTTDITKIQIGAHGTHPKAVQFTLDPNDPTVAGMPPAPTSATTLPVMQIGYDITTHQWTLAIVTKLTSTSPDIFSQGYMQVSSTAAISGLVATGLWPTDLPGRPTLLMNHTGGFADETVAAGLDTPVQCSSVTAGDFDNDMYVDLYLVCRTGASNIANILYHNNGNGTFTAVPNAGGAAGPVGLAIADGAGTADSVVTADYDVDGFLDLFVTNGFNLQPRYIGGPNKLFHNNGNANHWIELDLIGVNSDRDATGTRVYATANGVTQLRVQDGRYHRWSQDAKRIHFGLAGAQSVSLTVKWPSGGTQTFANVAANRLYQITEGGSNPVPVALRAAPTPPTGLKATAGNGSVQLTWTAAPGATSYNVYQGTAAGGEGTTAVMTAITGTTANVTPLANGTTYYFVVSADTKAGASAPSPEVSATPAAPASGGGGNGGGGGGGGAMDLWSLLAMAMLGAIRRREKRTRVPG
jgi:FG-GAP-like repeat/ASPIC and UnbV